MIGKIYAAQQLGFYTNANRFYELFIRQSSVSVTRVIFPAFSSVQDDRERFNKNYLRSFNMLAMLMFAITVTLIIASRPFISVALTEKWLPSVPYMQLFFIEGFFFPLLLFNQNILLSAGLSGTSLKIDLARKAVILIGILIVWRIGIRALIIGQVAATAAALILSCFAVARNRGIRFNEIMVQTAKLVMITAVCFLLGYGIIESLPVADWLELTLKCVLTPLFFYGLARLFRLSALADLMVLIREHTIRFSR